MSPTLYFANPRSSDTRLLREMLQQAGYITHKMKPIDGAFQKQSAALLHRFLTVLQPEDSRGWHTLMGLPYSHREENDGTWTVFANDTGKAAELGSRQVNGLRQSDAIELTDVFNRNTTGTPGSRRK